MAIPPSPLTPADIAATGYNPITQANVAASGVSFPDDVARTALAGRTMFGEKLRRLAQNASRNDPNSSPPWRLPDAWAPSTDYLPGNMVSANGYWWVCQGSGTSAATGTGPSNAVAANVSADNTAQWLLAGAPTSTANDPLAPTISRSTVNPGSNVAWGLAVSPTAAMVRLYGGYQLPTSTDRYRIATLNRSATDLQRCGGGRIAFWSDAAIITLLTPQTTGSEGAIRITIDGRYLTPSGLTVSSASSVYTTLDWTAVGGRKARYYEIEGTCRNAFVQTLSVIYTSSSDLIWPPTRQDDVRVWWISDSQSAGHGFAAFQPGGGIPQRTGRMLGWNDVHNASIGGTGYINAGSGPFYTFGQRVAEGLTRNPDVWVFYGSTNDGGQASAAITAAALSAYQSIRAGGSKAPIFVIGVEPVNAAAAIVEAAIKAAVTQFNDPYTFFIPLATLPYPPIIGTHNRPADVPVGISNVGRDVNSSDAIHLMESVQAKRARLLADCISVALASL
jgi:hypothetical protein